MHLAAALHRKLGWIIQAAVTPDQPLSYIDHAWVVDPSGCFALDSDGLYPIERNGFIDGQNIYYPCLSEQELKQLTLQGSCNSFSDIEWEHSIVEASDVVDNNFPLDTIANLFAGGSFKNPTQPEPDSSIAALPVLFHGTTRRQWRKRHGLPSDLYLTSSRTDAERYAEEAGECEFEDFKKAVPIVVQIGPSILKKLLDKPGIELQPDWGWVESQEHEARRNNASFTDADATWSNSLEKCRGVVISGFEDKFKKFFDEVNDLNSELAPS